jgi:hypothetical protein
VIDCSAETSGDTHCDSNAGKQYAEGTRIHYLAFEAYNARGLGITRYVLFYKQF